MGEGEGRIGQRDGAAGPNAAVAAVAAARRAAVAAERLVVREHTVAYVRHRRRDGNIDRAALRLAAATAVGARPARDAVARHGLGCR